MFLLKCTKFCLSINSGEYSPYNGEPKIAQISAVYCPTLLFSEFNVIRIIYTIRQPSISKIDICTCSSESGNGMKHEFSIFTSMLMQTYKPITQKVKELQLGALIINQSYRLCLLMA